MNPESDPVTSREGCPVEVWDGPYKMVCGRILVDGKCSRHLAHKANPVTGGEPLDVERLAWALHGWKQCDFGYCEGATDHRPDAAAIAAEYAALESTDA